VPAGGRTRRVDGAGATVGDDAHASGHRVLDTWMGPMNIRSALVKAIVIAWLAGAAASAWAAERFPPPDFQGGHRVPTMAEPSARTWSAGWLDVGLLAVALGVQTWLMLVRRSRTAVAWTTVIWLAYFGFWRGGCVCPIGATQDVAAALARADYVAPATVIVLFALPVLFALLFGRVFCSGVCPLGAIQDVVLVHPVRVPRWLAAALGVVPWIYLGVAVLLAATDSLFIICRYDPFVSLFRVTGSAGMLVYGGVLLGLSLIVGRPYCRFLCPYGALLGLCARVAWKRPTITPDECIACRLCKDACPVDAIRMPADDGEAP